MPEKSAVDITWVLFSASLVFLMQAGFMCLESGLTRTKNNINVATKNIMDFGVSVFLFWAFGFALMFGESQGGWFGATHFLARVSHAGVWLSTFFLFQAMFVSTATTIVSGAVAERMRFSGYVFFAAILSGLIYPLFGHWCWGGLLAGEYLGWLGALGFRDFAGSTVVHSTGGWVALAVVIKIGPRIGRFPSDGPPVHIPGSNLPLAILGTLLLWFGWFGFNGGSALGMNDHVPGIIVNTVLSGVAGLLTAMAIGMTLRGRAEVVCVVNGALAGLVSITASCNAVSAPSAIAIGAVGAVVMFIGESLLEHWRIDDVVGAVPVHACAGVWGTLAVAIFGNPDVLGTNLDWFNQFGVQLLGIVVCFVWSFGTASLALNLLAPHVHLRVSPEDEHIGLNVAEHGATSEMLDLFYAMDRQGKTGDWSQRAPVEPFTEVGQIAERYNAVLDRLERARNEAEEIVRRATDAIINFSHQVDGNALTVANGVEDLRHSIEDISKQANQVARAANRAVEAAEITDSAIGELGESSTEIGEITKVITSIAKQTNLLALNATIEAGRAGKAGKGFAVVANAVKDLSKDTAQAADDISGKVAAIQKDTRRAVEVIREIGQIIVEIKDYQNLVERQSATTTAISQNVAKAATGSLETARQIKVAAQAAQHTSLFKPVGDTDANECNGIQGLERIVEQFEAKK